MFSAPLTAGQARFFSFVESAYPGHHIAEAVRDKGDQPPIAAKDIGGDPPTLVAVKVVYRDDVVRAPFGTGTSATNADEASRLVHKLGRTLPGAIAFRP